MKKIAIFCGASSGFDPIYTQKAKELGNLLVKRNIGMVFGGGKVGMMGAIADEMLQKGGEITGVIPHFLRHEEVEHPGIEKMLVSDSMSERKVSISKMVDGYIAMPGGFGTLDEVLEVLALGQLNIEQKPIGFLNTKGFFDNLLKQFDHMVEKGFLKEEYRKMLISEEDPAMLLQKMENYQHPEIEKIVDTVASINNKKNS